MATAVIALVLAAVLAVIPGTFARLRYACSCAALAAMLVVALATAATTSAHPPLRTTHSAAGASLTLPPFSLPLSSSSTDAGGSTFDVSFANDADRSPAR